MNWVLLLKLFALALFSKLTESLDKPGARWNVWKLKRSDIRNIKLSFLVTLVGLEGLTETYVRIPQSIVYGSEPNILDRQGADSMVVIFPGAGGVDENILRLKDKIIASDLEKGVTRFVSIYDWSKWRNDFIRIAFDSQATGRKVCKALVEDEKSTGTPIKHLHSVGISVGAFAADACVKSFKENSPSSSSPNPTSLRLTLLDPFTSKGIFGYGWGVRNFGKTADLAINYLNSDDQVPTTSDPLIGAYNYDITGSSDRLTFIPPEGQSFHSWPIAYLASNWDKEHVCTEVKGENGERVEQVQRTGLSHLLRERGSICFVK